MNDKTTTVIGESLIITGEITSQEDVTIHGKLHGKISMERGSLVVAQSAKVEADAHVSRLTINGTFAGDVAAAERVELSKTAQVSGTVVAPAIVVEDGAVFNGMMEVNGRKSAAARTFEPHAKAS
jgi:cytoskeletal protein CcmA (bactofilin family)